MSDTEDDQELYEVERILAEREWDNEGTKYLVKWKGYPDEQCTWEGREAFTQDETLKNWRQQQASKDILDTYDLRALETRMRKFNDGHNQRGKEDADMADVGAEIPESEPDEEFHNDEENEYGSTDEADDNPSVSGDSDVATFTDDESGHPAKRARVGTSLSDAPRSTPTIQAKPVKKGTARRPGGATHRVSSKLKPRAPSVNDRPKPAGNSLKPLDAVSEKSKKPVAAPLLHRPNATSLGFDAKTIPDRSKGHGVETVRHLSSRRVQPARFYAPDLGQRPRVTQAAGPASALMRNNYESTGKKFKTLRHMNNAQKKSREEAFPSRPFQTFVPSKRPRSSTPPAEDLRDDDPGSPLFFPWDEKESERRSTKDQIIEADKTVISEEVKARKKSLTKHISLAFTRLDQKARTTQNGSSGRQTPPSEPPPDATHNLLTSAQQSLPGQMPTQDPRLNRGQQGQSTAVDAVAIGTSVQKPPTGVEEEPSRPNLSMRQQLADITQVNDRPGATANTAVGDVTTTRPSATPPNVSSDHHSRPNTKDQTERTRLASVTIKSVSSAEHHVEKPEDEPPAPQQPHDRPEVAVRPSRRERVDDSKHQSTIIQMANVESAAAIHPSRRMNFDSHTAELPGQRAAHTDNDQPAQPPVFRNTLSESHGERERNVVGSVSASGPGHNSDPSMRGLHPSEIITTYNGSVKRQWRKGDLILEFFLEGQEVGDVKVIGIPWEVGDKVIKLKEARKIPIRFEYRLNRPRYDELTGRRWHSPLGQGPVEPFLDTTAALSSLASYLEEWSLAAVWNHPYHDMMFVLYSCHSPEWRILGISPPRVGEPRLQLLVRQKFRDGDGQLKDIEKHQMSGVSPFWASGINKSLPHVAREATSRRQHSPPLVQTRSRRSSIASNTGPAAVSRHDSRSRRSSIVSAAIRSRDSTPARDILQSPGEQLARDLRNVVNFDDNAASKERRNTIGDHQQPSVSLHDTMKDVHNIEDTTSSFPGFDRDLAELSLTATNVTPKFDSKDVCVLLAHTRFRIQKLRDWFLKQRLPPARLLDLTDRDAYEKFSGHLGKAVGIIIFDINYPIFKLKDVAKLLEYTSLVCWQADFALTSTLPIPIKRIFPRGIAIGISEGCFIHDASDTLKVLLWFKKLFQEQKPACELFLAPNIRATLQEQALLTHKPEDVKRYLDIAKVIEELISLSSNPLTDITSPDSGIGDLTSPFTHADTDPDTPGRVVRPSWFEIYQDIPESDDHLSALDKKRRGDQMDERFLEYFAIWALRYIPQLRHFVGFTLGHAPKRQGHVRFITPKNWLQKLAQKEKSTSR